MDQNELRMWEDKCIQEHAPTCTAACPVHVDARALCAEISRGDFPAALKFLRKSVPFPGIIGHICDQPCRTVCRRAEIGDAIEISALEKTCAALAAPGEKITSLPRRAKQVAVIGAGLSGLTVAYDLLRKGWGVVIFDQAPRLGGSLWKIPPRFLPEDVLLTDLSVLAGLGAQIQLNTRVDQVEGGGEQPSFMLLGSQFDAVYVGSGAGAQVLPCLETDPTGQILVHPLTFATSRTGIFAGGGAVSANPVWIGSDTPLLLARSPIVSISHGRRAATSIDRYLQKVSLTASRSKEGPFATRLFTSLVGIEPLHAVQPAQTTAGFDAAEAALEAARCIQCQCLECVKVCEYLKQSGAYPRRYVREIYNNLSIVSGERQKNKFTNSCSQCALCGQVCPEDYNFGETTSAARRTMVSQERMPPSAHDFALRDMAFSNGKNFALACLQPGSAQSRYVFFPGCQLSASSPDYVEKTYAYLVEKLGSALGEGGTDSLAGMGLILRCCGAPADWAGRGDLFEKSRQEFLAEFYKQGSPTLILACSSCYHVFKTYYPEIKIVSLWNVLDETGFPFAEGSGTGRTLAVHDACSTRHESEMQDSVRRILDKMGYQVAELPLNRRQTECCGYGGLVWLANPPLARDVAQRRIDESPHDFVTYCAMCRDFYAARGKPTLHLLDLAFHPNENAALAQRLPPDYSTRHENRARLKKNLLKKYWGENMKPGSNVESISLIIPEGVRKVLEERLILVEDIQQVIEQAERTKLRLLNRENGHYLAYATPAVVTYWVEYSPNGDAYLIHNAYSHRMSISTGVQK